MIFFLGYQSFGKNRITRSSNPGMINLPNDILISIITEDCCTVSLWVFIAHTCI